VWFHLAGASALGPGGVLDEALTRGHSRRLMRLQ
jgi:hypothetical protein